MNDILEEYAFRDVPDEPTEANALPPATRKLSELVKPQADDRTELLKHRFLCRGGGLLLCGPTGIGKSSFSMQAMIQWAIGERMFRAVHRRVR